MKTHIWTHVKLPRQIRFLFLALALLLPTAITILQPIAASAATPPASATDLNELWDLGTNCHDFQNSGSMWNNCNNDQSNLHDGLKCSDGMFYQATDPIDPTHKLNNWFTYASKYADCYNKAKTQVNILAGQACQTVAFDTSSSSTNWSICQSAQNNLKYTLGCDPHMYQNTHQNDYWSIYSSRLSNCQSRLKAAGDVQIKNSDGTISNPASSYNTTGGSDTTGSIGDTSTSDKKLSCEFVASSPISWIVCPITDALTAMADAVDGWITDLLSTNTNEVFCTSGSTDISGCTNKNQATSDAYYGAWAAFRNIALGLMVIAGLVILIAQALGMEIIDAYTVRKTLPRLLIAAIGITLSWPLMHFAVDLTNDLGFGIRHLIYAPFSQIKDTFSLGFGGGFWHGLTDFLFSSIGFLVVGLALFKAAIAGILFSLAGSAALAVFVAIVVLILRQVAIIFLIILAPIAIVAYILPNTSKVYNLWWDSFMKALLMFPLIAGIIAAGRVFSAVTFYSGHDVIHDIIGFIAYFAPYFVIPFTVRFAGGFMRQIGGFVNDRSRGGFERLRNRRAKQWQHVGQDIHAGQFTRQLGSSRPEFFKKFDRGLQRASMVGSAGLNPAHWRGRVRQKGKSYDSQKLDNIDKEEEMSLIRSYDTLGEVAELAGGNRGRMDDILRSRGVGDRQRKDMLDAWQVAQADLADKGYSPQAILQGAALINGLQAKTAHTQEGFDYAPDGTYMGGVRVLEGIARQAGNDTNTEASLIGRSLDAQGKAGRVILPGFSSSLGALDKIKRINADSNLSPEQREAKLKEVADEMNSTIVFKEGVSAALGKTGHDTRNLIPTYDRLLKDAHEKYEEARRTGGTVRISQYNPDKDIMEEHTLTEAQAKDHLMSIAADVAYMQQVNQSMPTEKKGQVSALLQQSLGTRADGTEYTIQEFVNDSRGDPDMARHMFDIISQRERQARPTGVAEEGVAATRDRTIGGGGGDVGGLPTGGV